MPTQKQLEASRTARIAQQHNAAQRALNDPRRLASAARIVRAAVTEGVLSADDILTEDDEHLIDLGWRLSGGLT